MGLINTMHSNGADGSPGCEDLNNCLGRLPRFIARVQVQLRPSVLDPAGEATRAAASRLGVTGLQKLRIGKAVELELQADSASDAREQLSLLCDRLLANPVTENWSLELEELTP
jgi:phosphoribosylformylglycinamidine synthase